MPFALDSSAFIEVIHNTPKGIEIAQNFGNELMMLTSVTLYEVLAGKRPHEEEFIRKNMETATMLDFTKASAEAAAEIEKELKASGKMINQMDILLAGICRATNTGVITLDKDFEKVKGLNVKLIK